MGVSVRMIPSLIAFLIVTGMALVSAAILRRMGVRRMPACGFYTRVCMSGIAILYGLVGAEVLLFLYFTESHGSGDTLASRRWLEKYWKPVNAFGYRDVELEPNEFASKNVVWVVGDSHAAGWGIKEVEDRFSNVLEKKLGAHWRVINISKPGWDTRRQYEAVVGFPYRPDAVVHTYCLNDAERAAAEQGISMPRLRDSASGQLAGVVNHSYLANLIYWRWRSTGESATSRRYWDYIRECYDSQRVWETHQRDLLALLDLYQRDGARVVAVMIPNLRDVASSRPMISKVAGFFEAQGASTVDLTPILAGRNPAELVVNRFDPHANETVHRLIADQVYERLSQMQPVRSASREPAEWPVAMP